MPQSLHKSDRQPLVGRIELHAPEYLCTGHIVDLSPGGCGAVVLAASALGLAPNRPVDVVFRSRIDARVSARIAWVMLDDAGAARVGLQFADAGLGVELLERFSQAKLVARLIADTQTTTTDHALESLARVFSLQRGADALSPDEVLAVGHGSERAYAELVAIVREGHGQQAIWLGDTPPDTTPSDRVVVVPADLPGLVAIARRFADAFVTEQARRQLLSELARSASMAPSPRRAKSTLIGQSQPMRRVRGLIERVAPSDAPVLIAGETGTGKELCARELHARSSRARHPFVALSCAGLGEALAESELFGHTRGAFTGADRNHRGLFEAANRGTLFLDEIAELPLSVQAKLLRVLESGELRPLGSTEVRRTDVRVIVATNRPLAEMVTSGSFRVDLYHRLSTFVVSMPALRDRAKDIPDLVAELLGRIGHPTPIEDDAVRLLQSRPWPGNVRQLRHVLERALVYRDKDGAIDRRAIEASLELEAGARLPSNLNEHLHGIERQLLATALERHSGNVSGAAIALGLERTTFLKKCQRFGLRP